MCPACFLLRLWSENPRAALSLTASGNVGIKRVSCTLWKKLDKPAWCIHRVDLTGNLSFSQTKTAFLKILQAALHGARQIRSWLECDSDFFPPLLWALWLVVQEENSSQLVEGYGLSTEPLLDAMFFYVGCPAACAERWKQLSHLVHSIFISLPTSGGEPQPKGTFSYSHRLLFVQQVKFKPCSEGPPSQISFYYTVQVIIKPTRCLTGQSWW